MRFLLQEHFRYLDRSVRLLDTIPAGFTIRPTLRAEVRASRSGLEDENFPAGAKAALIRAGIGALKWAGVSRIVFPRASHVCILGSCVKWDGVELL